MNQLSAKISRQNRQNGGGFAIHPHHHLMFARRALSRWKAPIHEKSSDFEVPVSMSRKAVNPKIVAPARPPRMSVSQRVERYSSPKHTQTVNTTAIATVAARCQ